MSTFPTPYIPLDLTWLMHRSALKLRPVVLRNVEFWGVQVSEIEHPETFIENGAVVLTVGLAFRGDLPGFIRAVRAMAQAGAVAIGVGVGYAFDSVPDELVQAVSDLEVSIFEVPKHISFASILDTVQREREARAASGERQLLRTLIQLNDAANRSDSSNLTRAIANTLGITVALIDSDNRVLAAAGDTRLRDSAVALYEGHSKAVQRAGVNYLFQKMRTHGTVHHALAFAAERDFTFVDRVVIRHGAGLADLLLSRPEGLALDRARVNEAAIRTHLGLSGDKLAVRAVLNMAVDSRGMTRPVVFCAPSSKSLEKIRSALTERAWSAGRTLYLAEVAPGTALYLVRGSTPESDILNTLASWGDSLRIAVGPPLLLDALTPAVLQQLTVAAKSAQKGIDRTVSSTAAHWLFSDTVADFTDARLQELRATLGQAGEKKATEYLQALEAFLLENGNIGAASERIGIHRHTLRARIAEVESLLDTDLAQPLVRAELTIVLTTAGATLCPPRGNHSED